MNYYDPSDTLLMGADFNELIGKTSFPFYLIHPQNITEDTLKKKLKEVDIPLFRPYNVVAVSWHAREFQR